MEHGADVMPREDVLHGISIEKVHFQGGEVSRCAKDLHRLVPPPTEIVEDDDRGPFPEEESDRMRPDISGSARNEDFLHTMR